MCNRNHLVRRRGSAHGTSGRCPFHIMKFSPGRSCWARESYSCPEYLMEKWFQELTVPLCAYRPPFPLHCIQQAAHRGAPLEGQRCFRHSWQHGRDLPLSLHQSVSSGKDSLQCGEFIWALSQYKEYGDFHYKDKTVVTILSL